MDAKEVKTLLKTAREAIRNKDYNAALKACKAVLKSDGSHYSALVFVGVCAEGLQQSEQALGAYTRATEAEPAQPLAWQGLCSFYEKADRADQRANLAAAYRKLLVCLKGDAAKERDVRLKLAAVEVSLGDTEAALATYQSVIADEGLTDCATIAGIYDKIQALLSRIEAASQEQREQLDEALSYLLHTEGLESQPQLWAKHIDNLVKFFMLSRFVQDDPAQTCSTCCKHTLRMQLCAPGGRLVEECRAWAAQCPQESLPLEIQVQVYLDTALTGEVGEEDRVAAADVVTLLTELKPDSHWVTLMSCHGNTDLATNVSPLMKASFPGLYTPKLTLDVRTPALVQQGVSGLLLFSAALEATRAGSHLYTVTKQALRLLQTQSVSYFGARHRAQRALELRRARASVMMCNRLVGGSSESGATQAVKLCAQFEADHGEAHDILAVLVEAHLFLNQLEEAGQVIARGQALGPDPLTAALHGQLLLQQGDLAQAQQVLEGVVGGAAAVPAMAHLYLAQLHWARCHPPDTGAPLSTADTSTAAQHCLNQLLLAARADSYCAQTFLLLGHYYKQHAGDNSKASRCYRKAYNLDHDLEAAGVALVDTLVENGEEEAAEQVLHEVTTAASAGTCKWAWLRRGLAELRRGDHSTAIMSLQSSLRADPSDIRCWECLGQAYQARGSLTAALKAFTKATQLEPTATFACLQLAVIQQTLGAYDAAVTAYTDLLKTTPLYVPALKGLGETHLLQAQAAITASLPGRAANHCQQTLVHLTEALGCRSDLSCLWKLLGDATSVLFPLPDSLARLEVPAKLLRQDPGDGSVVTLDKKELLELGARCYGMALKLQPDLASLWHDLGLNYLRQLQNVGTPAGTTKENRSALAAKSVQCLHQAASLDPTASTHWNALGVVCATQEVGDGARAQHCFIRAVQEDGNNAAAWTNLGALYISSGNMQLAHAALKAAQCAEPGAAGGWVGQALVAETVSDDEAMDLFRHSTLLANHVEGARGYAEHVCTALLTPGKLSPDVYRYAIERMSAVVTASDALAKHLSMSPSDAAAYNMYGLLLERQKLYKPAAHAYARCLKLLGPTQSDAHIQASLNYARCLCSAGQVLPSMKQYRKLGGQVKDSAALCGMALSLFRAGELAESRKVYETALGVAGAEDRSHIYAALGMVCYAAADIDAAKSQLFECCGSAAQSRPGLEALLAVAVAQGDVTLGRAVLRELPTHPPPSPTLIWLQAALLTLQGDQLAALRHLQKAVHSCPGSGELWGSLSRRLLAQSSSMAPQAACCGRAALTSQTADTSGRSVAAWVSMAALGAGWHSRTDRNCNSLAAAQRAIHMHPDRLDNWCVLVAAAHAEQTLYSTQPQPEGRVQALQGVSLAMTTSIMARVETELSLQQGPRLAALHVWCVRQYVVALLTAGRLQQAQQFLQQAVWLYDSDVPLQSLQAAISRSVSGLRTLAHCDHSGLAWQLLASVCSQLGLAKDAATALTQWGEARPELWQRVLSLVLLACFCQQQVRAGCEDAVGWAKRGADACDAACRLDPSCSAAHLLVGLAALRTGNHRVVRREMQNVLLTQQPGSLTMATSVARQALLCVSMAKGSSDTIKELLGAATDEGDQETLDFYTKHLDTTQDPFD